MLYLLCRVSQADLIKGKNSSQMVFKLTKSTAGNAAKMVVTPDFSYQIVRSRRRSISIEVRAAQVVVRAPMAVAERELHGFVREKSAWVVQKIVAQQLHQASIPKRNYVDASELPFMGQVLRLSIEAGASAQVARVGANLQVYLSRRSRLAEEEQARRLVSVWYQEQALAILTVRTQALCARMGLQCTAVTIKATRSKWGHCTSRGAIQYNWQIILAPLAIVDYLVAHEVCHLRYHDHSPAFWQLVASVCPSYRADRAWLRQHGARLVL